MACKELEEFLAASQGQLGDPQVAAQKNEIFARAVQEDSEKAQEILLKSVQTNTQGKRQRTRTNLQAQEKEEEISVEEETAPPPGGKKGNKGKLTEHSKTIGYCSTSSAVPRQHHCQDYQHRGLGHYLDPPARSPN